MQKTKTEITKEANSAYLKHINLGNKGGTLVLDMGSGKTKIGLDIAIKVLNVSTCLIVSPRSNLTGVIRDNENSWIKEIDKWYSTEKYRFTLTTIQDAYKWNDKEYDLVILDECHTILTKNYSNLLKNNKFKYILGLTGTPGLEIEGKQDLYTKYAPIIFEYMDSAKEGLINKSRVLVFERELNNNFKITSGSKKKSFMQGEFSRYNYLNREFEKQKIALIKLQQQAEENNNVIEGMNLWLFAREWGYNNKAPNSMERAIAMKFLNTIQYRKKMLHNLTSSVFYAKAIKEAILKDSKNKVLIFTEEIAQADKITEYTYHSKMTESIKNKNFKDFNEGTLRELGSSKGLTLGLNLEGANYGILESYIGSTVDNAQKKGRGHRLAPNEIFTLIIFKIKNTQQEKWFDKIITTLNTEDITYYDDINKLIKDL